MEGLVALRIDVSLIGDDARRAGGGLLDVGQLLVWSGHCGNRGRRRGGGGSGSMSLVRLLYCASWVERIEEKLIPDHQLMDESGEYSAPLPHSESLAPLYVFPVLQTRSRYPPRQPELAHAHPPPPCSNLHSWSGGWRDRDSPIPWHQPNSPSTETHTRSSE